MYVHHTPETKAQALVMRSAGKSVTAISKELHVAENTLRN